MGGCNVCRGSRQQCTWRNTSLCERQYCALSQATSQLDGRREEYFVEAGLDKSRSLSFQRSGCGVIGRRRQAQQRLAQICTSIGWGIGSSGSKHARELVIVTV